MLLSLQLLLLLLGLCPGTGLCPDLCTCYPSPMTISCQSQAFSRVPTSLPQDGRRIFLQNNRITELGRGAFPSRVAILWLYANNISAIAPSALENLGELEELDLGDNGHLRTLAGGTFSGLVRLQTLHLHRCGLSELPDAIFRKLYSLQYLYLQENGLLRIQNHLFADLGNLSYLFLHGNRIGTLNANSLRGLVKLDRLLLHQNRISLVQRPAFRDLGRLATLFLFNNSLAELPASAMGSLPSLRFLRLNGNPWACGCRAWPLWDWFRRFEGASSDVTCVSPEDRKGLDLRFLTGQHFRGCPPLPADPGRGRAGAKDRWRAGSPVGVRPIAGGTVDYSPMDPSDRGLSPKDQGTIGNSSSGSRGSESPLKGGPDREYWADYYDEGDLTSSTSQQCSGQECWRNKASPLSTRPRLWLIPLPIWGLTFTQRM